MPLDPDFVADCLYGPEAILIDEVLEVDAAAGRVRARMPTHDRLPLTSAQRIDELRHPRHVSGGLMVHMTGVMGFVHFYYVLGLRIRDGWTGFGVRIQNARFRALARPGEPLILEATALRVRRLGTRIFVSYRLRFAQNERLVYEGEQTALWLKIDEGSKDDLSAVFS
jgi:hypothetical protein